MHAQPFRKSDHSYKHKFRHAMKKVKKYQDKVNKNPLNKKHFEKFMHYAEKARNIFYEIDTPAQ